jgi:hypothetical protein
MPQPQACQNLAPCSVLFLPRAHASGTPLDRPTQAAATARATLSFRVYAYSYGTTEWSGVELTVGRQRICAILVARVAGPLAALWLTVLGGLFVGPPDGNSPGQILPVYVITPISATLLKTYKDQAAGLAR